MNTSQAMGIVTKFNSIHRDEDSKVPKMEIKAWKYLITNPNHELTLKVVNGSVDWKFFNREPEPISPIDLLCDFGRNLAKDHKKVLTPLQVKVWAESVWESDLLDAESRQILVDLADRYTSFMKDQQTGLPQKE